MENGYRLEPYSQLAVRFALNELNNLQGSGLFYRRNAGEDALVLTAAHVVHDLMALEEGMLLLTMTETEGTLHTFPIPLGQSAGERIFMREDYVHDPSGVNTAYDAAYLTIPWEDWMDALPRIRMEESWMDAAQICWGFPATGMLEGVSGRTSLKGRITNNQKGNWWVEYSYDITLFKNASRQSVVGGFSGSGVFQRNESELVFSGVVSCASGTELAGARMKLGRASLFMGWIPASEEKQEEIPESLDPYIDETKARIRGADQRALSYFEDRMLELIDDRKLTPVTFLDADRKDRFQLLPCAGHRESCNCYWSAQLTNAVCFCGILEKEIKQLQDMKVEIGDREVHTCLVCTSVPSEELIRTLLDKRFFANGGGVPNNTIILLANEDDNLYHGAFMRSQGQNIISRITEAGYNRRKLKELLGENSSFNIVTGEKQDFNIAMIGMGNILSEVIMKGMGKEKSTLKRLNSLLEDVWEIDEDD